MNGVCWNVLFLAVLPTELVSDRCDKGIGNCSNIQDGCTSSDCKNGATCVISVGKDQCVCSPGYTGDKCKECTVLNPCTKYGTCQIRNGIYSCDCMQGCTDYNDSTNILDIDITPCQKPVLCREVANQYNCTCVANHTESEAGSVCFNTSAYNYTLLHDKGVHIQDGQTSLQFKVKACSDVHVLLMTPCTYEDIGLYEIVIGGWSNTMSTIRIANQQISHNVTVNHTFEPLNCYEMKTFWIDWKHNAIQVGNGSDVGSNQFMHLNGSGNMTMQYLAIATLNHTGYWIFNASKCIVTENTTIQTGDKSTTDTQTAAQTIGNTVTSLTEETTTKIGYISITDTKTTTQTTGNMVTSSADKTTTQTGDISTTYINTTAQTTGSMVTSVTSSRNTHNIVPSNPTVETTETIQAINSTCSCPCHLRVNQTEIERAMQLKTAIELIRRELKMEKKNLSSTIRKKTCARDERVSAKTMGFTLGVCVLTTVFGSIIMWDLVRLGKFIWKRFQ